MKNQLLGKHGESKRRGKIGDGDDQDSQISSLSSKKHYTVLDRETDEHLGGGLVKESGCVSLVCKLVSPQRSWKSKKT